METKDLTELLTVLAVVAAMAFVFMAIISGGLSMFVGLKYPPNKRALWTVGLAYLAAVAFGVSGGPSGFAFVWPLASLPPGLVIFWYWRRDFSRNWYDDPNTMPEGVNTIDDDWKSGLTKLIALLVAGALLSAARHFLRH